MESLSKLFGSEAKVKIMRLFLFNKDKIYSKSDIRRKSKVALGVMGKIIGQLQKAGLIKKRNFIKEEKKGKKSVRKKTMGWMLNQECSYFKTLQNLMIENNLLAPEQIIKILNRAGKLKLVIISGIFIQDWDSRVDMLIVGDKLKMKKLEGAMQKIESNIGKELTYAVFETSEFLYRLKIYDKLIRDILDYPHEKILKKIELN